MRRRTTTIDDGEVYIDEVECCEGEELEDGCFLMCQKRKCSLYQSSLTAALALCLPNGYTPSHENVLELCRLLSRYDAEESVPLDGLDEEERPLRDDRDDDLWDWDDERE